MSVWVSSSTQTSFRIVAGLDLPGDWTLVSDWRSLTTPMGWRLTIVHESADAVTEALVRIADRRLKEGDEVRVRPVGTDSLVATGTKNDIRRSRDGRYSCGSIPP